MPQRCTPATAYLRSTFSAGRPYQHLHAFGHALSSVLAYLRASLAGISSTVLTDEADTHALTALWAACADAEEHVQDMAALCGMVP